MSFLHYVAWHYTVAWWSLARVGVNFLFFALHICSVAQLLRTLFFPWHRIHAQKQRPGFDIPYFFYRLTLNLISRFIGFFIRLILIAIGLFWLTFFLFLFSLLLIIWPFCLLLSWPLYYWLHPREKTFKELLKGEAKSFVLQRFGIKYSYYLKNYTPQDVKKVVNWYLKLKQAKQEKRKFWKLANLYSFTSVGSDLAYGFTPELDKYSEDLTRIPDFSLQLIGHDKEVRQLEAVLGRSKQSHALLLGEPGVGKHTVLMGLAKAIGQKRINPSLFYHRVLVLHLNELIGSFDNPDKVRSKLIELFKEAKSAGNVIIVIKDIAAYVSNKAKHDFTSVFTQFAQTSKLKFITIATPSDFEQYIWPNSSFMKYFEKVKVSPASEGEALDLMQKICPRLEKGKRLVVSYPALKEIVGQSSSLMSDLPFPEKALDLLDQIINKAYVDKKKTVGVNDVDILLAEKLEIPVGGFSSSEQEKLLKLEKILKSKIIGQEEALQVLTSVMQRFRLGLSDKAKPIGSFLFLGPTGVGKTETAKALASAYFGSVKQLMRFDMAEYQGKSAVADLIGSKTSSKPGTLVKAVRQKPYAVLLLDEFEKAPKEVKNLFLTVFDEGYLYDHYHRKISFANMIIICTSNAAGTYIQEMIKDELIKDYEKFKKQVLDHCLTFGYFSSELINRFDNIIVYRPLTRSQLREVATQLLNKLAQKMKRKGIILSFGPKVSTLLSDKGYNLHFGARQLQRVINDEIEGQLAVKMLKKSIKNGDTVNITTNMSKKIFLLSRIEKMSAL